MIPLGIAKQSIAAHNFTGISLEKRKKIMSQKKLGQYSTGFANAELIEPVPDYIQGAGETVNFEITGRKAAKNNCWIIFGRDRWDAPSTGYGGRGDTQSAAIYICAGMSSAKPWEEVPPPAVATPPLKERRDLNGMPLYDPSNYKGSELRSQRSPHNDASIIYLSQKTDIDGMFDLGGADPDTAENPNTWTGVGMLASRLPGMLGMGQYNVKRARKPSAGIAIKSDNVRIIGRESIRIQVTPQMNALGGNRNVTNGISLIGGGDPSKSQPMVKGYQLITAIEHIKKTFTSLEGIIRGFAYSQMLINEILANHEHVNGPLGLTEMLIPYQASIQGYTYHFEGVESYNITHFKKTLSALDDFTNSGINYILSSNTFCD